MLLTLTGMMTRNPRSRPRIAPKTPARIYLSEYMVLRGMEPKDLAAHLDVTEATISRWRSGERKLSTDKQRAVEEVLGLPPGGLFVPPGAASEQMLLHGLDADAQLAALSYIGFLRTRGQ